MNTVAKHWKQDREGLLSLMILVTVILLYLVAMTLWLVHEWNIPVKDYKIIDLSGHAVSARVTIGLYRKLFKRDKG